MIIIQVSAGVNIVTWAASLGGEWRGWTLSLWRAVRPARNNCYFTLYYRYSFRNI